MPGGTQRRGEQGDEEAAHGAGQRHVPGGKCGRSERTVGRLCRARTPKALATLERDFEQTIAYYALDGVARELIRTNRELRRKFRQVCCFGSLKGAEVAIYIQVKRLNARWSKQPWWETARSISTVSISTLSKGYATAEMCVL